MGNKNRIQKLVSVVWINQELKKSRVSITEISHFTGIGIPYLSKVFSGKINLSKSVKVLLYLYFRLKCYDRKSI